jgi:hypothetical protein
MSGPTCSRGARPCCGCSSPSTSACSRTAGSSHPDASGPEAQQLFEKLAPNLGETAFLRWMYRDLASRHGGLPELFSPQPAEVAQPSDELSRALIAFWRHRDADTGATWSFAEERFEGELMGDLYQELDPVVKDRFALCQTPDFVRTFILDRTLTPAIETFGADEVRLLDPACGSGHFLIDGLKRLVAATAAKHPDWERAKVVAHALDRVVGVDLNDYACALARARLIMTAAELAGVTKLADAARFHPHVYWADGLEQVEKEEQKPTTQFDLFTKVEEKPRATLTRSDVRAALKKVFEKKFHAVVANPPFIVESDDARKAYHREKAGKNQRYVSAYRQYGLGSPFTERCFQLAERAGFVGLITSNNFMKREFGKPLIEKVLAGLDLTRLDTSQAYIPFRHCSQRVHPDSTDAWQRQPVTSLERRSDCVSAPWRAGSRCRAHDAHWLDEAYYVPQHIAERLANATLPLIRGEDVRDWRVTCEERVIAPYDLDSMAALDEQSLGAPTARHLLRNKTALARRTDFGKTLRERSLAWFEWSMFFRERLATLFGIAFPVVATHNHFAFSNERAVFNSKAPVIKLSREATERDYLSLLGLLNSSTACFWMKQVFHCRGAQGVNEGMKSALWEQFFEFDSTKVKLFPALPSNPQVETFARRIDELARARATRSVHAVLEERAWPDGAALRGAIDGRHAADFLDFQRMIGLQDELDWLCYALYGLETASDVVAPDQVEACPRRGSRGTSTFAERDAANRAALARGEEPDELPSVWWERHGWEPLTDAARGSLRRPQEARIEARRARTAATPALALIETANFKRRWYKPDYAAGASGAERVARRSRRAGRQGARSGLLARAARREPPRRRAHARRLRGTDRPQGLQSLAARRRARCRATPSRAIASMSTSPPAS